MQGTVMRSIHSLLPALTLVSLISVAGCSNGMLPGTISAPSSTSNAAIAGSAHRALAPQPTAGESEASRSSDALSAFPVPMVAQPIALSAFPVAGQAAPASGDPLCANPPGPGAPPAPAPPGPAAAPKPAPAPPAPPTTIGCAAKLRLDVPLAPSSTPAQLLSGMQPGWINALYDLPPLSATAGSTSTVAIVVAYDDPAAEADLAVYRNTFGLPPCTMANGCFKKIAEDGSSNYPAFNAGWSIETSTDLDTVSAVCPGCKLLLVEASSNLIPDLATSVDTAVAHGATVVSNSYGVPEASDNVAYASHYNHPNVAIVASAGDSGYGPMFPADVGSVIAVGGTSLYATNGGISEVVWPHTDAGCSAFIPKPSFQHDSGCPNRTMNDVAVVGDPATGMAVYDSVINGSEGGGWAVVGGTSIGSPIIASIIAMGPTPSHYTSALPIYNHQNTLFAITAGNDGTCSIAYLCTAGIGYSGPAGVGSPNGTQAFNN